MAANILQDTHSWKIICPDSQLMFKNTKKQMLQTHFPKLPALCCVTALSGSDQGACRGLVLGSCLSLNCFSKPFWVATWHSRGTSWSKEGSRSATEMHRSPWWWVPSSKTALRWVSLVPASPFSCFTCSFSGGDRSARPWLNAERCPGE